MKTHKATYLDSGFYLVSDAAAGALVRVIGKKLPPVGYEKFVMLKTERGTFNAWLQRADVRHSMLPGIRNARGWRWAIYGIRPDGEGSPVTLGKAFAFEAVNSTQAVAA